MANKIILAHKEELAMKSATPIFLHDLLDKAMIDYVIDALGEQSTLIVAKETQELFQKQSPKCTIQGVTSEEEVYSYICSTIKKEGYTIVCHGNTPMIDQTGIQALKKEFEKSNYAIMALSYNFKQTGVFCIKNSSFTDEFTTLTSLLDKKEVSNFDIIKEDEFFPITNRYQLSTVENEMRREIIKYHLFNGVSVKNIDSVTIGPDVIIGEDTIIYPNTYITGKVSIGKGCKLGPFLRIRQAATLADGVKLGNFVELKNATLGEKSASAHLSYLGDCTLGKKVNIGCGAITVNYDGANKHHTTIEDDAFIGCNVNMIAPITVGASALVAAGSTITKDVPASNLSFARARQVNKEGYVRKTKA